MIVDPWFYAVAIPAVILVGLSKGGFAGISALSLPLLALQISPLRGAVIMLPILMIQDVVSVWAYWRKWDWANLKVLLPGALAGIAAGYFLAAHVSDAAFKLALGIVSLVFGARYLLSVAPVDPKPVNPQAGLFWGAMSGFTSMIANIGGPPFQIYVMPQRLPRDVFVGTMTLFFAVVNWVKVPPSSRWACSPARLCSHPSCFSRLRSLQLGAACFWSAVFQRMTSHGSFTS